MRSCIDQTGIKKMTDQALAEEIDSFIEEIKAEIIDQIVKRKLPERYRLMAYYRALFDERDLLLPLFRSYRAITGRTHILEIVYDCATSHVMAERHKAKQAVMSPSY
jgi:hypothetical protein